MKFLLIILLSMGSPVYAQTLQTVYFDTDSKATSKEQAHFYSVITRSQNDTSLYTVETYIRAGNRMLSGTYRAIHAVVNWEKLYQFDFAHALKEGIHQEYYPNGTISFKSNYAHGLTEGRATRYEHDGILFLQYDNKQGKPEGEYIEYHKNGKKKTKLLFKEGKVVGKVTQYDENEQVINEN